MEVRKGAMRMSEEKARGNTQSKVPEARMCLMLRASKEASVAGVE